MGAFAGRDDRSKVGVAAGFAGGGLAELEFTCTGRAEVLVISLLDGSGAMDATAREEQVGGSIAGGSEKSTHGFSKRPGRDTVRYLGR